MFIVLSMNRMTDDGFIIPLRDSWGRCCVSFSTSQHAQNIIYDTHPYVTVGSGVACHSIHLNMCKLLCK